MEPELFSGLFEQAEAKIAEFKKETYAASFKDYLESNARVWNEIGEATEGMLLQEQGQAFGQAADRLVEGARGRLASVKGRGRRDAMQYNLNLYMVSYVLPALLAWQKRRGIREEDTRQLTDVICDRWQAAFGARIQASDQEAIQAGFKQKLCFVTTAVCQGLRKSQNCKEILLMKQFRDGYFSRSEEGKQLIQEYYDIAPTIVKRIARQEEPEAEYQYLWSTYIKKCVGHIEHGEEEQCSQLYKAMMTELKQAYMVTDTRERNRQADAWVK